MKTHTSKRTVIFLTGFSLLLMAVLAGLTMGFVFNVLFTADRASFEFNLQIVESNFGWGLIGWCLILVLDLYVSWGLWQIYRSKSVKKALIVGLLRFFYSLILAVAVINLFGAYSFFDDAETNVQTIFDLVNDFQSIWHTGLIVFGLHLIFLAALICEKKVILRIISLLLLMAGLGYMISNIADLWIENYAQIRMKVELVFILPMIFGEIGLALWLMYKGGKKINHLV